MLRFTYVVLAVGVMYIPTAMADAKGCDRPASEMTLEEYGQCQVSLFKTQGLWNGSDCTGNCADNTAQSTDAATIIKPVTGSSYEVATQTPTYSSGTASTVPASTITVPSTTISSPSPTIRTVLAQPLQAQPRAAAVFFDSGRASLKQTSIMELQSSAQAMMNNPSWSLAINGYASGDGNFDNNMKLSSRRAAAVYLDLLERGVSAGQLTYHGFGSTNFKNIDFPNSSENRRVELVLSFTGS